MISIIIINFNTFDLTCRCIESVVENTKGIEYEIILVDNASTECKPEFFTKRFQGITLVTSPVNLGFAGGNNLGIEQSKGDYILLLNSDTIFTENCLGFLSRKFETLKRPGFVGIKTFYPDGSLQFTCERLPSLKNQVYRFFFITRFFKLQRNYSILDRDFSPEAIWGSFLFFKKDLLFHLPGKKLDELFFMYHEDLLWCWQARKAGFKNYFVSGTSFIHVFKGSQLNDTVKTKMDDLFNANFARLEKIINGSIGYPVYSFVQRIIRSRAHLAKAE